MDQAIRGEELGAESGEGGRAEREGQERARESRTEIEGSIEMGS